MLAAGGHAVDAAIATNAVLGVVMPSGCGIGGDAFWLVWDEAAGEQVALNGSGRAPAARNRAGAPRPRAGPDPAPRPARRSPCPARSAPGRTPIARWGRLSRDAVLAAAIEQADAGFPAWDALAVGIERTAASLGNEPWSAGFRGVWQPGGRRYRAGDLVRLPALAATLRILADEGFDAYLRRRARRTDRAGPGGGRRAVLRARTFARTTRSGPRRSTPPTAACASRRIRRTAAASSPSRSSTCSAGSAPPDGARFDGRGWSDAGWLHRQLEAAKLAFADRDAFLADPAFRDVPVDRLLGTDHAATLAARIDPARADPAPPAARILVGGTIYLAVVDAEGNAVSLIQSNAAGFGSGVLDPDTGVHFQNRGSSFSLDPASPNVLEPGKRPAHTLMPGMLFREGERRPWVVAGSMGGDIQPQIHVQLVSAMVDGGADIATAVAAPRVVVEPAGPHHPPVAVVTDGELAPGVADGLIRIGHDLSRVGYDGGLGHEHAIELVDGGPAAGGTLAAATDPRSFGQPAVR